MKTRILLSLAFLACTAAAPSVAPVAAPAADPGCCPATQSSAAASSSDKITGDYVEARTASVFAGACHFNGELVTTGDQAVMAWRIDGGSFDGVDLAGVRVMAAVSGEANLRDDRVARKTELVIDAATDAQASAVAGVLRARSSKTLGEIVAVRRAAVRFERDAAAYAVRSDGFASLSVRPMDDDGCCTQPTLVWYAPLTPLANRKVGYTQAASYTAAAAGDRWQRAEENSAFYGTFSL